MQFKPGSTNNQPYISGLIGVSFNHFRLNFKWMQKARVSTILEQMVLNAKFAESDQLVRSAEVFQWDRWLLSRGKDA